MPYVFDPKYEIESFMKADTVGSGKSNPVKIGLKLREKKEKCFKIVEIIIK